jgi:hypothetical protein
MSRSARSHGVINRFRISTVFSHHLLGLRLHVNRIEHKTRSRAGFTFCTLSLSDGKAYSVQRQTYR